MNRKKNNKRIEIAVVCVVALLMILTTFSGCTTQEEENGIGDEIVIGGTLPLSGMSADAGQRFKRGMETAVEKINDEGGVLGAELKLELLDDGMDSSKVGSLYEQLITQKDVDILVPSYGAPMTIPALVQAQKHNKLMISGYTSSAGLNQDYGGDEYFSINTQTKEKRYSAWWYNGLTGFFANYDEWSTESGVSKPTKIAVLSEDQYFGQENHELWKENFADEQGWNIVVEEYVDISQMDFSSILTKIENNDPDVILCEFYYFRCVEFIKQMREQGVTADFIAMSESGTTADWVDPEQGVGSTLGDGIFTYAYVPKDYNGGMVDYLRETWPEKYDRKFGFLQAAGAAQIEIIAQVIEEAESLKTSDIREALLNNEFECCYTKVQFTQNGGNSLFEPAIGEWIDGELETVYPTEFQTHEPVYPYSYED